MLLDFQPENILYSVNLSNGKLINFWKMELGGENINTMAI